MTPLLLAVLVFSIIFISTLIRSAFGFGNALIAMPLLILLVGVKIATPLVALVGLGIALVMLYRTWRDLEWWDALLLLVSSLAGIPLGLYFLSTAPEGLVKGVLGLILVGFGLFNLVGLQVPETKNRIAAIPFGFLAGILGGAYNANGPPIVVYGVMRGWDKDTFRSTLQGYFLFTSAVIVAGQALAGLWTWQVLFYFLASLPLVILAVWIGDRLMLNISEEKFNQVINLFLILMGILMFF
jgi:uncharacterized membrane protein YfcA